MLKNKLKLSMVAALAVAGFSSSAVAGKVIAPNIDVIEVSGAVELKQVQEKSNTSTVNYRTSEIDLNFDAKAEGGIEVFTSFKVFNGTQAGVNDAAPEASSITTTYAYAILPIGEAKIVAGLAPDGAYGTEAFDGDTEVYKIVAQVPVAKNTKIMIGSKANRENKLNKNEGDMSTFAIGISTQINGFDLGLKTATITNDTDANLSDGIKTEVDTKVINAFVGGEIAGVSLAGEYVTKDVDGAASKQKGFFVTAGKEFGNFTAGVAYVKLEKGLTGGDGFAPGMILDGNVDSSLTQNTSAVVVPLSYAINDKLSTNFTYIDAKVQGKDATEIDIGLTYGFSDNVELSATYGDYDHVDSENDTKNIELAIAIAF